MMLPHLEKKTMTDAATEIDTTAFDAFCEKEAEPVIEFFLGLHLPFEEGSVQDLFSASWGDHERLCAEKGFDPDATLGEIVRIVMWSEPDDYEPDPELCGKKDW